MADPQDRKTLPRRQGAERRVLTAALGATPNLAVLGVGSATAGALAVSLGPVAGVLTLALSAVSYAALVGLDLFNPKFVEKTLVAPGSPKGDGVVVEVLSAELRAQLEAVRAAYARVAAQVEAGERGVFAESLSELAVRAASLVEEAGRMAQSTNPLVGYLADGSDAELRAETDRLEKRAVQAQDAEAAASFRQAAAARQRQLATRGEIAALVERIAAQLTVIETSLDEMRARLVKMSAQDAGEVEQAGRAMVGRLASLRQDVVVLESSIADISHTVKGALG